MTSSDQILSFVSNLSNTLQMVKSRKIADVGDFVSLVLKDRPLSFNEAEYHLHPQLALLLSECLNTSIVEGVTNDKIFLKKYFEQVYLPSRGLTAEQVFNGELTVKEARKYTSPPLNSLFNFGSRCPFDFSDFFDLEKDRKIFDQYKFYTTSLYPSLFNFSSDYYLTSEKFVNILSTFDRLLEFLSLADTKDYLNWLLTFDQIFREAPSNIGRVKAIIFERMGQNKRKPPKPQQDEWDDSFWEKYDDLHDQVRKLIRQVKAELRNKLRNKLRGKEEKEAENNTNNQDPLSLPLEDQENEDKGREGSITKFLGRIALETAKTSLDEDQNKTLSETVFDKIDSSVHDQEDLLNDKKEEKEDEEEDQKDGGLSGVSKKSKDETIINEFRALLKEAEKPLDNESESEKKPNSRAVEIFKNVCGLVECITGNKTGRLQDNLSGLLNNLSNVAVGEVKNTLEEQGVVITDDQEIKKEKQDTDEEELDMSFLDDLLDLTDKSKQQTTDEKMDKISKIFGYFFPVLDNKKDQLTTDNKTEERKLRPEEYKSFRKMFKNIYKLFESSYKGEEGKVPFYMSETLNGLTEITVECVKPIVEESKEDKEVISNTESIALMSGTLTSSAEEKISSVQTSTSAEISKQKTEQKKEANNTSSHQPTTVETMLGYIKNLIEPNGPQKTTSVVDEIKTTIDNVTDFILNLAKSNTRESKDNEEGKEEKESKESKGPTIQDLHDGMVDQLDSRQGLSPEQVDQTWNKVHSDKNIDPVE